MPLDYGSWLLSPPQMEAPAPGPSEWELKRQALIKAIQEQQIKGNDYWEKTWEGADTVETRDVDKMPWGNVNGWTACDKARKHCVLVMRKGSENYKGTLEHEQMHATGFDHPKYRYDLEHMLPSLK